MDKVVESLRSFIEYQVREGFDSVHDIVRNASDYASEKHGRNDMRSAINDIVADLLAGHQGEQASWQSPTDCDRLDDAFNALNEQGIVARQNFSCCNNCGFTEIWDEVDKEEKRQPVQGYVFYHLQCTQRAIHSGILLLAYGCVEDNEESFIEVANRIVAELHRTGLNAKWEGTAGHPIVVEPFVWRKRR